MSLNLEGREKLREFVEEQLKKVPAGKRLVLPNETLEQLLFEEVIVNEKENIRVKFPVWSGKFLRKLDLSHVSFENVTWRAMFDFFNDSDFREFMASRELYIHDEGFENRVSNIENLKRLYEYDHVDYSGTNAIIDLSESFEQKYKKFISVKGCDFSYCNIQLPNEINDLDFFRNNFSNSTIKLSGKFTSYQHISECDFENCDLSECQIDVSYDLYDKVYNNYTNSKATLFYDVNRYIRVFGEDLPQEIKDEYYSGCYINGELIRTPEEIIQEQSVELERMFGDISTKINSQLGEEKPRTM